MKSFDYCVFISRFQPFNNGHYELVKEALKRAETLLIVIGSYKKASDIENPWSAEQREQMIRSSLSVDELNRIKFLYVRDSFYVNNKWLSEVQQLVYQATDGCDDNKICLIGKENLFPQWKLFINKEMNSHYKSSNIRGLYFTHDLSYKIYVPTSVVTYLEDFKNTETFKVLKNTYDYVRDYKTSWSGAPFPVTFNTVDCIVIKSGHVLTVRRKGNPGKGQIALPGGFLNTTETILAGALRELKEETGIKVDKDILESCVIEQRAFDYPKRSVRGRTITHAFLIDLGSGPLPPVKGQDDADKAWWMSLSEFASREEEFFEDHFHIISYFISKF
ncbi:bifunctional nicotinamide mononucleotide adenylyltransferase/ADP-ribose pyrophosphatase [uncultured Caudovirales phage]|uniref:Bifunctional nicotinamide mononucleotide adenylyltransferase/ADP-ribose pyrophosphatase n=1 Tax=uncultured Caudovirales phage TaxID=2100421 RepID=A0A6J5RXA6_9CAUD|nr:bifunctional nicotinamide mononucleotide adenylyltransferase/ADP-ribose pyrophosphatase [uncultured Caudovirales phage]